MFDKMKQLMEFKKQAEIIRDELGRATLEIDTGKGIRIIVNGTQDLRRIEIDPDRLLPDGKAALEEDLLEAVNQAVKKSQETAAQRMASFIPSE